MVRSFSQLSTPLEFFPSTCWPNSIVGTLEVPKPLWSPVVNHKYKHIWFCCSEKSEDSYIEVEYIYQPLVNTPSLIRKKNASIFWMNFFGGEFRAPQTLLGDNVQAKNISAPLNHTGIMIPGFFRIPIQRVAPSSFFNSTECFCPYGCACHGWIPLSPRKIWCSQGSIPASWPQYQTIHPLFPPPGPTGDIANVSFHCCLLDQKNCKIKTTYIKEEGKSRCLSMFFLGGNFLRKHGWISLCFAKF